MTKYLHLLPQFSDSDPDGFFRKFESSATPFQLLKEDWIWLITQFSDYDPDGFFRKFESSATPFQLPKENWTWLITQFSNYNPDGFFKELKSFAAPFQLPKEDWTWLIRFSLNGKALSVLGGVQDNTDHDVIKRFIFTAYAATTKIPTKLP